MACRHPKGITVGLLPRVRSQGRTIARASPRSFLPRTGTGRRQRNQGKLIMERDLNLERATAQVEAVLRGDIGAPHVKAFFDEPTFTASYVVHDPATGIAAVVDSVLDFDQPAGRTSFESADAMIAYVETEGLTLEWLFETHAHADHPSAATYLQERLGGKLAIGAEIVTVQDVFGKIFNEGTRFARDEIGRAHV